MIENLPVPRLPAFYGIVIYMYRPDHSTAALHAQYGEHIAQIELGSLKILNGQLSGLTLRLVREWARLHADELKRDWELAQALEPRVVTDEPAELKQLVVGSPKRQLGQVSSECL